MRRGKNGNADMILQAANDRRRLHWIWIGPAATNPNMLCILIGRRNIRPDFPRAGVHFGVHLQPPAATSSDACAVPYLQIQYMTPHVYFSASCNGGRYFADATFAQPHNRSRQRLPSPLLLPKSATRCTLWPNRTVAAVARPSPPCGTSDKRPRHTLCSTKRAARLVAKPVSLVFMFVKAWPGIRQKHTAPHIEAKRSTQH